MQFTTTIIAALALAGNALAAPASTTGDVQALGKRQSNNLFFWDHANFGGNRVQGYTTREGGCMSMQFSDIDLRGYVSSLKIPFAECRFYDRDGCQGNSVVASNDHIAYVGDRWGSYWNDRIRSAWCRTL